MLNCCQWRSKRVAWFCGADGVLKPESDLAQGSTGGSVYPVFSLEQSDREANAPRPHHTNDGTHPPDHGALEFGLQ